MQSLDVEESSFCFHNESIHGGKYKVANVIQQIGLTCMIVSLTLQHPPRQSPCPHVHSLVL